MDKGLLIMIAIGIAIVYFATNFSGDKPADNSVSWTVPDKKHSYDPYYETDLLGDRVLNLTSVSLDQAKRIWPTTPTSKTIAKLLPDFTLAKTEITNRIVKGAFRHYLLEYLEQLEGKYLAGEINSERVQKAMMRLQ